MSMQVAKEILGVLANRGYTINEALETMKEAENIIRRKRAGLYEETGKTALSEILKAET